MQLASCRNTQHSNLNSGQKSLTIEVPSSVETKEGGERTSVRWSKFRSRIERSNGMDPMYCSREEGRRC